MLFMTSETEDKKSMLRKFYFEDPFMDFAFLHILTLHGFKGSEISEIYSATSKINENELDTWRVSWKELAEKVEEIALTAEERGHSVTAREAYLRAVTYYRYSSYALRFSDPRFRSTIEKSRSLFQSFAKLSDPPIEIIEIPYEGKTLPGFFMRHDASGSKRPTIIIGDNASEELYYWIGPPAVERGYNVLLVDLPGMGLNSFNGINYRPDTEVPVKAVIDYLYSRNDVDTSRIAVYGGGETGGYIMTRASAYENRIRACIVDPFVSDMESVASHSGGFGPLSIGQTDPDSIGSNVADCVLMQNGINPKRPSESLKLMKVDISMINCPVLGLNDSGDNSELLRQANEAIESTSNSATTHMVFSAEEANFYRQLDNFSLKHRVMFDWLDEVFDHRR
jgi:hypothetical protein